MKKYIMKDINDYRVGIDETKSHGVVLIKRDIDGIEWALGDFATIDEDMQDLTNEEIIHIQELNKDK